MNKSSTNNEKNNPEYTLILCGRIESAVGSIAYSTCQQFIANGRKCCFLGLNSTPGYIRSSFDYSVNSKLHTLTIISNKQQSNSLFKRLFYGFLRRILSTIFGDHIYGVKYNERRMKSGIKQIIKKFKIARIVSFYMPIEVLSLGHSICTNRNIEFVPFLLDSVKPESIKEYDLYFYSVSKVLCVPYVVDSWFLERYGEKIIKTDLPIIPWDTKIIKNGPSHKISFLVYGALYDDIRNPTVLLDALLNSKEDFTIKTFCSGCKDLLLKYKELMPDKIFINDRVSVDVLHNEIIDADFTIIIGNNVSNQIPSKLYEIIGSGKPIIYLYQSSDDFALDLIKKYKLSYVVKYSDLKSNSEFEKLFDWCRINAGKHVCYDEYICDFPELSVNTYIERIVQ